MTRPSRISIQPVTPADAAAIACWRYSPPYEMYSFAPEDADWLLRPELHYHAAFDKHHELIGYFCFGKDARIPAALESGLYADERLLDIGLGMRPDRNGQGLGPAFLSAGLEFGQRTFSPDGFRLAVAAWNSRAVRLYERTGFSATGAFTVQESGMSFLVMTRLTSRSDQARPPH